MLQFFASNHHLEDGVHCHGPAITRQQRYERQGKFDGESPAAQNVCVHMFVLFQ